MRFHFSYILTGVAMMSLLTGCIKDNNNIKSLVIQNPGIGFPYGANNKNDFIIRPSSSAQQVPGLLLVTLEAAAPASSDIHITVADNSTALVNAYNSANGTAIQPLPRALWSIPSQLIIKTGDQFVLGDITITNTLGLNTNQQFAVGLTITAADGGNKIADNLKSLFIVFRIQNVWDGRYSMKGQFRHPTGEPIFTPHVFSIELHTYGSNSVVLYNPQFTDYIIPITQGGVTTGLPNQILTFSFLGNDSIRLWNSCPYCNGWVYDPIPFYNGNSYHNRWDPVAKIIYAAFGYQLGSGGTIIPATSRAWIDTLTYLGPR